MNITRYCVGVGKTAGDYPTIIATSATTYVGCLAARTAMHAGNWDGDTLVFVGTFGAADREEFPSSAAAGTAITANTPVGVGGIQFGTTSYGPGSKADGVTFDFTNVTSWDMRGCSAPTARACAACAVVGERVLMRVGANTRIYPPDYATITGAVAASGTAYADDFSPFENNGLAIWGNGQIIGPSVGTDQGYQIDGTDGWCRSAARVLICNAAAATRHLRNGIEGLNVRGAAQQIDVGIGGYLSSGQAVPEGAEVMMRNNRFGAPSWGGVGASQAVHHGGDWNISGNFKGRAWVYGNIMTHGAAVQDSGQTIGSGVYVGYNRWANVKGAKVTPATYWKNMGSGNPWVLTTELIALGGDGNALKMGLSPYDGANAGNYPSAWLGADGTGSGTFSIPELCNIVHANEVDGCEGLGFAANGSAGMAILYNRVRNARLAAVDTAKGNFFLVGNYLHLSPGAPSGNAALSVGSSAALTRLYSYNNILVSEVATQYDMRVYASALTGSANAGNVFGSGRILVSGTDFYTEANDINGAAAVDVSSWNWDRGFPAGHWLNGAGTRTFLKTLRTSYGDIDCTGTRLGDRVTPGPFAQ